MFKQCIRGTLIIFVVAVRASAALMTHADCSAELGGISQALNQPGQGSATAHCSVSGGASSMSGEADASAQYGFLSAGASAFPRNTSDELAGTSSASASAMFEDTLTVAGSGVGFVRATLIFSISTFDGGGEGNFSMAGYVAPTAHARFDQAETIDVDVPIEFGMPFPVSASLTASSLTYSYYNAIGTAASFAMIELFILGPDKVPLSNSRYIAASNADYGFVNASLTSVPEPGTATLFLLGCSAGCFARLLRARRHKP